MHLEFRSLFSGSTGNSTLAAFDDTLLLIDAGRTGKILDEAARSQGFDMRRVRAILVTHEHIDHIRGVGVLARKYGMEVYASPGTWAAMADKVGEIPARQRCEFTPDEDFYIDRVNVLPFSIPHDAAQPTGFALSCGGRKVSVLTDLGHTTKELLTRVEGSDVLLLEANHDVQMLTDGSYPERLKRRILSGKGHLSNDACGRALTELLGIGVPNVYLGHLSEENNVPELAYSTVARMVEDFGAHVGRDVQIRMTYPNRAAEAFFPVRGESFRTGRGSK